MKDGKVRSGMATFEVVITDSKRHPIAIVVSDGNIEDYNFRLTPRAARRIGKMLIKSADMSDVIQVMES